MKLFLIESAGKIKKLKSILGSEWNIKATMGHIVELAHDGEDSLGFTVDAEHNRIDCRYVPRGTRGKQVLKELREAVRSASTVILATDPDREGETIAWHLAQQLKIKQPQRVTYTEITEKAVRSALARPRPIDYNLVAAGRCRDTLDKLVGFKGSPLLWKLNNGAKSMGRVQSATLHILCQREREIKAFVPQDYWSVFVDYAEGFRAFYAGTQALSDSTNVDSSATDDAADPKDKQAESVRVLSQQQADSLLAIAQSHPHHVVSIDSTATTRKPPAPFTTSSMQQAAGTRLKYNAEQTMKIAQSLYEQGYITYMRTDSVQLSESYCVDARDYLQKHDPQNVPAKVAQQKSKAGAQEAHEAIRPTEVNSTPLVLASKLKDEDLQLYQLIWNRALASQCQNARLQKTRIITQSGAAYWQARGQVVTFPGYTRYWNDLSTDSQLPILHQQQTLTVKLAAAQKKQTVPPPRYSEPKLVQIMENEGIGRPSTYAPTVKVLREREYVGFLKGNLQPTQLGMEVDEFLSKVLPDLIQPEFTAQMEQELDAIAEGKRNWEHYLVDWNQTYFTPALETAYRSIGVDSSSTKGSNTSTSETTEYPCPVCGKPLEVYGYTKNGEAKQMLRCSDAAARRQVNHQKVAYFVASGGFWSPTYGEISQQSNAPKSIIPVSKKFETKEPTSSAATTNYYCPVCIKPLEVYEYTKDGEYKKMLRCSDPKARQQHNHKGVAFFASKGTFWSPKFGEVGKPNSSKKVASPKRKYK